MISCHGGTQANADRVRFGEATVRSDADEVVLDAAARCELERNAGDGGAADHVALQVVGPAHAYTAGGPDEDVRRIGRQGSAADTPAELAALHVVGIAARDVHRRFAETPGGQAVDPELYATGGGRRGASRARLH